MYNNPHLTALVFLRIAEKKAEKIFESEPDRLNEFKQELQQERNTLLDKIITRKLI